MIVKMVGPKLSGVEICVSASQLGVRATGNPYALCSPVPNTPCGLSGILVCLQHNLLILIRHLFCTAFGSIHFSDSQRLTKVYYNCKLFIHKPGFYMCSWSVIKYS